MVLIAVAVSLTLGLGALVVSSLALAHVLSTWTIVFFYVLPGSMFILWGVRELSPQRWRGLAIPLRRRWRTSPLSPTPRAPEPEPVAPVRARPPRLREPPLERALRPWLRWMRVVLGMRRHPIVARSLNVLFAASAVVITVLAFRDVALRGWPLGNVNPTLTAASCAFFLTSLVFKAFGWQRLFRRRERPSSLALAAATGAAAVAGLALPGRLDDALRVAMIRRLPGCAPGVGTVVLSLFLLGLIDTMALAPLAAVAAVLAPLDVAARAALGVVAFAGVGAGFVLSLLPHVSTHRRLRHYRVSHWLGAHAPASARDALAAAGLVSLSWALRATGVFVLLHGLGFLLSFPLALAYLAAGSASAALPVGPAGAATQAGVGAAALAAAGVSPTRAIGFAIVTQGILVATGGVVAAYTMAVIGVRKLIPA